MSNAMLNHPWNLNTISPRRTMPLCKVTMLILVVMGSSCALSTPESPPGDAMSGDHLSSACDPKDGTIEGPRNPIEGKILALVNRERRRAGVGPLCFSPQLANAAREHNRKMLSQGFFDHRGRGEGGLLERVTFAGLKADEAAENIFTGSEPASPAVAQQCVAMWMHSDGHRRNMLSSEFDKTGISVSYSARSGSYVTADFAHAASSDRRPSQHSHRVRPPSVRVSSGGVVPVSGSSKNVRQHESLHS